MGTTKMTKKEAFLYFMKCMDIEMLDLILDDGITYFGVRKDVFLKKLNGVFEEFKKSGDSVLEIHNGECGLKSCNLGSKGYCFLGNVSRSYINLIFFGSDTDVTDICQCSEFITDVPEVISMGGLSLIFGIDEKIGFVPSIWYIETLRKCEDVYNELMIDGVAYLLKEDYIDWLKSYKSFHDKTSSPFNYYQSFKKFSKLYCNIRNVAGFLKHENDAEQAMKDFFKFNLSDEALLLEWLVKYEGLIDEMKHFYYFWKMEKMKDGYLDVSEENNIFLLVEDYKNIILFKTISDEHHEAMRQKYASYTDEEWDIIEKHYGDKIDYNSLKFYLKMRGMFDEEGKVVIDDQASFRLPPEPNTREVILSTIRSGFSPERF